MLIYTVQRLGLAVLICVVAMAVMFAAVYVIPGDPASIALGPRATAAMKAALTARMGLDQPVAIQLVHFFANALSGDLGHDVWSNRPVTRMILDQLPFTLALTIAGLGWAVLIGIPLGCYSALRRSSRIDKLVGIVSVAAIAIVYSEPPSAGKSIRVTSISSPSA